MANKKYYYVLVFTSAGPKYVTGEPQRNWCEWKVDQAPKAYRTYDLAKEVATGLACNFFLADVVVSPFEITEQPYNYKDYDCKFEKKEVPDHE